MANQLNQIPASLEPLGRVGDRDIMASPVWYQFFRTLSSLFSSSSPVRGGSAVLDTIGNTLGGMLARFGDAWHEFVATAPNQLVVLNPGAPPSLRTFIQLLNGVGAVQGEILFRGALGWEVLPPVAGGYLQSLGPGTDPHYATGVLGTSVATGLTATGTTQADALALVDNWNEITTTPANTGVVLFNYGPAVQSVVFNPGANALNVYPPVGGKIDALALNAPYPLPTGKSQVFYQLTSDRWRSSQLG